MSIDNGNRTRRVVLTYRQLELLHRIERDLATSERPHLEEDRALLHCLLTAVEDAPRMCVADLLIAMEEGDLDDETTIALFQQIIDDGTVRNLAPCYRHLAQQMIRAGHCTPPRGGPR